MIVGLQWSPVPERPKETRLLSDRELALVEWLAEVRYATTADAATWLKQSDRATGYQADKLSRIGFLQWIYISHHGRRTRVWTASRHARALLMEADPGWSDAHPHWVSVAEQRVAGYAVAHALARNRVCLDILMNSEQLDWAATWMFPTPRFVEPHQGVAVVPDAMLAVKGHLWCVEMERSWRGTTMQRKVAQYQTFYEHRAWGRYFPTLPRVLMVLSERSTQERSLSTWLADVDRLRVPWLAVLPWAELMSNWQSWVWASAGGRHQVSWLDLHAHPVRLAPTPPVESRAARPRRFKLRPEPELPWEE